MPDPFLQPPPESPSALAHSFYDISPLEPYIERGVTLLTPNSRLARLLRTVWGARQRAAGRQVWESPAVVPLQTWLQQQWRGAVLQGLLPPTTLLSSLQQELLWRSVIEEDMQRAGRYSLLQTDAAAAMAASARELLLSWKVDPQAADVAQLFQFEQDCSTFLAWLQRFEEQLARHEWCTPVDCAVALQTLGSTSSAGPPVLLVDFDEVSPLARHCLSHLCSEVEEFSGARTTANLQRAEFSEKRTELEAVARWAAQIHSKNPNASIGIVIDGQGAERVSLDYLLRREFDCLGERYQSLPVNFSAGISLDQAPVARDALRVLSLGLREVDVSTLEAVLRSRFVSHSDSDSTRVQQFLWMLYREGERIWQSADLRYQAARFGVREEGDEPIEPGQRLQAMFRMEQLKKRQRPSAWIAAFNAVLDLWGWPGPSPLDSLEYQQVERWYDILDGFHALDGVSAEVDYAGALSLLRESCRRQIAQPETEGRPVQVLGPLEAAGLQFDFLWVSGVQASNWPAPARPNPLLPVALQTRLQMPHASPARERQFADTLFARYAGSCGQLIASYCRSVDGVPALPSALIASFPLIESLQEEPGALETGSSSGAVEEYLEDELLPPLPAERAVGGSRLLEDQSQCPFRAAAAWRLQVSPLPQAGAGLSPAERGSLVHDALYALWGELSDQAALLATSGQGIAAAVGRAAVSAIDGARARRRNPLGMRFWEIEQQRTETLLQDWLQVERQRAGFAVEALEADFELQLGPLEIHLRVDRVDRLPGGGRFIVDYKTGASSVRDWLGERPAKPQLLLYSLAAPERPAALAFARVKHGESAFVGLGEVEGIPGVEQDLKKAARGTAVQESWEALNEHWRVTLQALAEEFARGVATVAPLSPKSCEWCGLQPLCRVADDNSPGAAEEMEAEP